MWLNQKQPTVIAGDLVDVKHEMSKYIPCKHPLKCIIVGLVWVKMQFFMNSSTLMQQLL